MGHELRGFAGTKRYEPVRLLGVGGMGAVYEVIDHATQSRVALKVMLDDDPRRLLRFKHEFRVMAELHHRNLVRLFDLGQHEGRWFFTMERVHGQNLIEVLLPEGAGEEETTATVAATPSPAEGDAPAAPGRGRGRMACDPDAFVLVVAQILDALSFLHLHGIVHRDLKPSNILVDLDGVVRVLDFGLAGHVDRAMGISQDGAVVGTLGYLSPEQCRGEPASAASDLYALGCMTFQLLTGELPFPGPPMAALAARCDGPPPGVDDRVVDAPAAIVAIVRRLMARDPAERPSIAEVRAALGAGPEPPPADRPDAGAEIFVGRERELTSLTACLERAARGDAQVAFVSGPSGIGKSALADRAVHRAERLGFLSFRGRCYEREQVPFVAFDRLIDALILTIRRWPREHLAALAPSLSVLARIFPTLGMLVEPRAGDPAAADPRELRQEAVDGLRRVVAYCQAEAPLLFVLDDLQWADEESVALLSAMLAAPAGRVMILGLFRAGDLGADAPLSHLLREVEASGRAASIVLDALAPADAARLVEAVTGSRLGPTTSETLASQTAGNPFLVRRLAEHLATLPSAERIVRLDAAGSTGDLLRDLMRALSPRAEEVLALAATAGGDIAAPLLREASGLGGEDFDLAVGELSAARFLQTLPRVADVRPDGAAEPPPRLDLYHDRIREVTYEGLGEERRRALHRSLAVAIEAQPEGRGRDADVLLRHWSGAGDRALRRRYAVEAAEQAVAKLAFLRAARLFRVALDDPEPGEPALAAAPRWERTGDLFDYGGRHADAADAYGQALRLWDEAPPDHPDRRVARLRLSGLVGVHLMAAGRIAEGRAVLERGLALLGLPLERPLAGRLAVLAGLTARAALAERVEDLRASLGPRGAPGAAPPRAPDASAAAEVRLLDMVVRALQPLWPLPAAEAALRADVYGRRVDDKTTRLRTLAFGASVPVLLGRCTPAEIDRAHRRLDAADRLAREHDLPFGRELVQLNRGLVWLATDAARARRSCEAALDGFVRRGMAESFDCDVARVFYLLVLTGKGDDDDALAAAHHDLWLTHPSYVADAIALGYKAPLLARRGLFAEAREALRCLEAQLAGVPVSRLHLMLRLSRAAALLAEGRFAEVLAGEEAIERDARATGVFAIGLDRSMWLSLALQAACGLLSRNQLPDRARRRAHASAEWLAARGVLDYGCLGHRALAMLHHAEGRPRAATAALRRALMSSTLNTRPYHRWLCLRAARDVGVITLDQEVEATEIAAAGRFVTPPGLPG